MSASDPVILSEAKDLGGDGRRILRSFALLRMTGVARARRVS
jgi:hypothetical protein